MNHLAPTSTPGKIPARMSYSKNLPCQRLPFKTSLKSLLPRPPPPSPAGQWQPKTRLALRCHECVSVCFGYVKQSRGGPPRGDSRTAAQPKAPAAAASAAATTSTTSTTSHSSHPTPLGPWAPAPAPAFYHMPSNVPYRHANDSNNRPLCASVQS